MSFVYTVILKKLTEKVRLLKRTVKKTREENKALELENLELRAHWADASNELENTKMDLAEARTDHTVLIEELVNSITKKEAEKLQAEMEETFGRYKAMLEYEKLRYSETLNELKTAYYHQQCANGELHKGIMERISVQDEHGSKRLIVPDMKQTEMIYSLTKEAMHVTNERYFADMQADGGSTGEITPQLERVKVAMYVHGLEEHIAVLKHMNESFLGEAMLNSKNARENRRLHATLREAFRRLEELSGTECVDAIKREFHVE